MRESRRSITLREINNKPFDDCRCGHTDRQHLHDDGVSYSEFHCSECDCVIVVEDLRLGWVSDAAARGGDANDTERL